MSDTPDDKIELLVRSVLTAVDMRLGEVRHEMHAVAAESEQRHRQVLQHMHDLEHRLERRSDDTSPLSGAGDSLAQRMDEVTQVLLARVEELHQRNTIATNERFALINNTLEQLGGAVSAGAIVATPRPSMLLALDAMDAPLRVGPITAQQPAAPTPATSSPPLATDALAVEPAVHDDDGDHDIVTDNDAVDDVVVPEVVVPEVVEEVVAHEVVVPELVTHQVVVHDDDAPVEPHPMPEVDEEPSAEIDMDRLADLLSERLEHMSLPTQLQ